MYVSTNNQMSGVVFFEVLVTSLNKMQLQNITRLGKLSSSLQAGSYKHFIPCHLNKLQIVEY